MTLTLASYRKFDQCSPTTVRLAAPDDQFACISLDTTVQSRNTWLVDQQTAETEITVAIRPVRLPRPHTVSLDLDMESFGRLWTGAQPFLVAERDDTVVGWLAGWPEPDGADLRVVACVVAPRWRRQGVGRQLVGGCRDWAARAGLKRLRAVSPCQNDVAARWLWQSGWRFCGWEEQSNGHALIFSLPTS